MLGGAGLKLQHTACSGIHDARERERSVVTLQERQSLAFLTLQASAGRACILTYCKPPQNSSPNSLVTAMARRRLALVVGLRIAAAYVPPATRARRSVQLSAKKIDFVVEEEARDFLDVSSVFLDSFWADKAGSQELTAAQRRELRSGQLDDFRRRYALRRDTRRKATLFVAKDGSTIIGCAGVELDGAADENLVPVLSNVATAREGRRRGVATTLVREAEKRVREWGCTEMDLVVEESNKPARNLYAKLGYRVINKEQSDTLVPTDDGRIAKQTTTTLTMRRDLNGGGSLLPVAGAVVVALGAVYVNLF
jgi:ribosomal protein S18 acetylase RimI-like enzyme